MEQLEKVEKLREKANVSYEEAKKALEESNWDMLDAMLLLEKEGKVSGSQEGSYSTSCDQQEEYISVEDTVKKKQNSQADGFFAKMGRLCGILFQKGQQNDFSMSRKGQEIIRIPVWVFVVILLFTWHTLLPLMLIGLFFDCHYRFCGKDNLHNVNEAMEKASEFVDKVKDEYDKL